MLTFAELSHHFLAGFRCGRFVSDASGKGRTMLHGRDQQIDTTAELDPDGARSCNSFELFATSPGAS